jgi:hypothetical protein
MFASYGAVKFVVNCKINGNENEKQNENHKKYVWVHMIIFSVLEIRNERLDSDFVFLNTVFLEFYFLIYIVMVFGSFRISRVVWNSLSLKFGNMALF